MYVRTRLWVAFDYSIKLSLLNLLLLVFEPHFMEQGHLIIIKKKNNNRGNISQMQNLHRPTLGRAPAFYSGFFEVEIVQDLSNPIVCLMHGGFFVCLFVFVVSFPSPNIYRRGRKIFLRSRNWEWHCLPLQLKITKENMPHE